MKLFRTLTTFLLSLSSISLSVAASPLTSRDHLTVSDDSQATEILEKRADVSDINIWYNKWIAQAGGISYLAGLRIRTALQEEIFEEPDSVMDTFWKGLQAALSFQNAFFQATKIIDVQEVIRGKHVHYKKVALASGFAIGGRFEVPDEYIPVIVNAITAYFEHNTIAVKVTEVSDAFNIGGPIEEVQNSGAKVKRALQCKAYDLSSLFHHSVTWDPHSPLYSMKVDC